MVLINIFISSSFFLKLWADDDDDDDDDIHDGDGDDDDDGDMQVNSMKHSLAKVVLVGDKM